MFDCTSSLADSRPMTGAFLPVAAAMAADVERSAQGRQRPPDFRRAVRSALSCNTPLPKIPARAECDK